MKWCSLKTEDLKLEMQGARVWAHEAFWSSKTCRCIESLATLRPQDVNTARRKGLPPESLHQCRAEGLFFPCSDELVPELPFPVFLVPFMRLQLEKGKG